MVFQFGLVEEIVVGPAIGAGAADRAHVADDAMIGADMQMPLCIAHVRGDAVDDAG